jgi:LysM repeat protein
MEREQRRAAQGRQEPVANSVDFNQTDDNEQALEFCMNNPNPLIPQGSLLEQSAKGKPHLRIALCIAAAHVVFLGLLLMQGCKRETDPLPATELASEELPWGRLEVESLYRTNQVESSRSPVVEVEPEPSIPTTRVPTLPPPGNTNEPTRWTLPPPPVLPEPERAPEVGLVREHLVEKGDTFSSLARDYRTTVSAIAKANPNADPARLRIGQKLLIPPVESTAREGISQPALPPGVLVYGVKSGDTLSSIAREHRTTVASIREMNQLTTDRIVVGQKLKIASQAGSAGVQQP